MGGILKYGCRQHFDGAAFPIRYLIEEQPGDKLATIVGYRQI